MTFYSVLIIGTNSAITAFAPELRTPAQCAALTKIGQEVRLVFHDGGEDVVYDFNRLVRLAPTIASATAWDDVADWVATAEPLTEPPPQPPFLRTAVEAGGTSDHVLGAHTKAVSIPECVPLPCISLDASIIDSFVPGSSVPTTYPATHPFPTAGRDLRCNIDRLSLFPAAESLVPVCGGSCYFPVVYGGDLYALHAADTLRSTYNRNRQHMLLDFSPWGGMSLVRFSECELLTSTGNLVITLPETIDVTGKSLILVLAGKLFLIGEAGVSRPATRRLMVPRSLLSAGGPWLSMLRSIERSIWGTTALADSTNELTILASSATCFVIVVDVPRIYQWQMPTVPYGRGVLRAPVGVSGILRNSNTRELRDYIVDDRQNATAIGFEEPADVYVPKGAALDHHMQPVGYLSRRDSLTQYRSIGGGWELVEFVVPKGALS